MGQASGLRQRHAEISHVVDDVERSLARLPGVDAHLGDKTGTLTQNELSVTAVRAIKLGSDERDVLGFAALASSSSGEDLIDTAVRNSYAKAQVSR